MKAENLAGTDDLTDYTPLHRENYLLESAHLAESLPLGASVLQVGSMDGARAIGLLQARPDLRITGLDIEQGLTEVAVSNAAAAGVTATFVTGDILSPPTLPRFDFVICLNNTLSYIFEPHLAILKMHELSKCVIVSVFTDAYDLSEATSYCETLGLSIESTEAQAFVMSDGWRVHRFTNVDVESWGGEKTATPLGWLVQCPTVLP
jgi:SAM-dependent methyltransferase